ncbi:MAG: alginate lyase family protein, partial [Gemmatimonadaceae bacterium]
MQERLGQAVARCAERLGWRDAAEPSDVALLGWLGGSMRSTQAWRDTFAARETPKLFAGFHAPEATARAIRAVDPAYAERAVKRADDALGGRFDLLGYRDLPFGWPIDWHYDPVSGIRVPRQHWSAISYLDPAVAGDHKVVWELNRQQWLVDLGAAWWLTGDERYGRGMVTLLSEWMDANPPKRGVNWASSLEVAFRAMSWVWALEFLRNSPLLDAATLARLTKYVVLHGRHLERYLSTYFSPNTHLTGEALGLFYLGTYFPELSQAARWRELGQAVLIDQLPRHVLRDGVYFEQSVHYHRYTVDFYTHFWLLDEVNGGTLRVEIAPQLDALLEHVQCLTRGDGSVPLFGDEDGGRLFLLDARPINDLRGMLATGAVLLERKDFAFVAGEPTAEVVWLAGPDAAERFHSLGRSAPEYASRAFEHGGVYVMRDGWGTDANHIVVDCGPHGAMNCGHAHADALSFELALRGRAVFVDPGTYTYSVDPRERDAFRSTAAHNAATVDGANSSDPDGPFHWRRIAASRVMAFRSDRDGRGAYFEGSHDGFEHLPSPVRYRRSVDFDAVDGCVVVIRDVFDCASQHSATLTFQCAPDIEAVLGGPNHIDLTCDGQPLGR